jgi:hypothetical protein
LWWPAERLIVEGVATLQEVETWYSFDDVLNRCAALDSVSRARAEAQKHPPTPEED